MRLRLLLAFALMLAACNAPSNAPSNTPQTTPAAPGAAIAWQPFAAGMAQAVREKKPVLLVIGASWCSHCRNYEKVFLDSRVVGAAEKFVMIRIDEDREPQVAERYRVDGNYVPRTYFLEPDGSVADVHAENPRYRYFYDERNPGSILAGMRAALAIAAR